MAVHRVSHEVGWRGLVEAVKRAKDGDEITIESGQFVGSQTIVISKSLTLTGAKGTQLSFEGRGPAIWVRRAHEVELNCLEIRSAIYDPLTVSPAAGNISFSYTIDPSDNSIRGHLGNSMSRPATDAAVLIEEGRRCRVFGCSFARNDREGQALLLENCDDALVRGCSLEGYSLGIVFWGSRGAITENQCRDTAIGIEVHDAHESRIFTASATIENNTLIKNGIGIRLVSAVSESIAGNKCDDCDTGIALERCRASKERPVSAKVTNNTVLNCQSYGIKLTGSDNCEVKRNCVECCSHGAILAHANPNWDNPGSEVLIEQNTCTKSLVGVQVASTSAVVKGNDLHDNISYGIVANLAEYYPAQDAVVQLIANRARHNPVAGILIEGSLVRLVSRNEIAGSSCGIIAHQIAVSGRTEVGEISCNSVSDCESGIILSSSKCDKILENKCFQNRTGITLEQDNENDLPQVEANLIGNSCYDNRKFGIFLDGVKGSVQRNKCSQNGESGLVFRPRDGTKRPSKVDVIENTMEENGQSGIVSAGPNLGVVRKNQCSSNKLHGIVVTAISDEEIGKFPLITENICRKNEHSGIIMLSADSRLEANSCMENGIHGIALETADVTPDIASSAAVSRNVCNKNKKSGIAILSSNCDRLEQNECQENGINGIAVEAIQDKKVGARVDILTNNKVSDNSSSGIYVSGAEVSEFSNNFSGRNGKNGIIFTIPEWAIIGSKCELLSGNECCENDNSGIVFYSSAADLIENNSSSWNGLHGITLSSASSALDIRSSASLRNNRCSNNKQSGICLFAADAGFIDENECYGNGYDGIALYPLDERPKAGSIATITNNRLHHNNHGIRLFGSSANKICGNSIWGNKYFGIGLLPFLPRRVPSEAFVEKNVISGSGDRAILVRGSNSLGLKENWLIENTRNIFFEDYNGDDIVTVDAHGVVESNVHPSKGAFDRKSLLGSLIAKGFDQKQAISMAGFLRAPDCAHCFAEAVLPNGWNPDEDQSRAGTSFENSSSRHLRISFAHGEHVVEDVPNSVRRPIGAIGEILERIQKRLGAGQFADPSWIALVSADDSDVQQIADIIQNANTQAKVPGSPSMDAAHHPVTADYSPRNRNESTTPREGLLEAELISESISKERFQCLFRMPEIWLVLASILFVGWLSWDDGLYEAVALSDRIRTIEPSNVVWTIGVAIVGYALVIAYLNVRLPSVLRFRQTLLIWIASTANVAISVVPHDLITRLDERFGAKFRQYLIQPMEDWVWCNWVGRKLRSRGRGVHTIVLTQVEAWRSDDLRRLQALVATKDPDHPFCIVLQLNGRANVFPLLLKYQQSTAWPPKFDLLLNDYDDELRISLSDLDFPDDEIEIEAEIAAGLAEHLGAHNPVELAELRGSLTDDEWWPIDLLPSLSIGSAPAGKFSVRRKIMLNVSAKLHQEIRSFNAVFEPNSIQREWTDQHIRELFERAANSPSARVYKTAEKRMEYERIAGRVGKRREIAKLVARLWANERETRQYLVSALRCGILAQQDVLRKALLDLSKEDNVDIALRALDASIFLARDLRSLAHALPPKAVEDDSISENWRLILERFNSASEADTQTTTALDIYPALVSAWWMLDPDQCDQRIAEDMSALKGFLHNSPGEDSIKSLRLRSLAKLSRQLKFLSFMESELATDTVVRLRQMDWRRLPDPVASMANAIVDEVSSHERTLSELIHDASDETLLKLYANLHSRTPMKVLYHFAASAALYLEKAPPENRLQESVRIAANTKAIADHVRLAKSARLSIDDLKLEAKSVRHAGNEEGNATLASFMSNQRSVDVMYRQLRTNLNQPPTIPFVLDRELDRLLLVSERILQRV